MLSQDFQKKCMIRNNFLPAIICYKIIHIISIKWIQIDQSSERVAHNHVLCATRSEEKIFRSNFPCLLTPHRSPAWTKWDQDSNFGLNVCMSRSISAKNMACLKAEHTVLINMFDTWGFFQNHETSLTWFKSLYYFPR